MHTSSAKDTNAYLPLTTTLSWIWPCSRIKMPKPLLTNAKDEDLEDEDEDEVPTVSPHDRAECDIYIYTFDPGCA